MSFKRLMLAMAALVGVMGLFAGNALASTDAQAARGQCGGQIHSWQQYVNNLTVFGAVPQAAKINQSAGYAPRDGSFTQWLKERVVVTRLAAPATITNYGCNASGVFPAGKKYLTKGWPVLVTLPAKYSKKDVRMNPARGYKAVTVMTHLVGQASCTNPGKAIVKVVIFVKVKKVVKAVVSKPKLPANQPVCVDIHGAPLFAVPQGMVVQNGVCVTQTVTTVACNSNQTPVTNSQGVVVLCIDIVNVNNNVNNNNVVVNTPPPCNCAPPPPCTTCTTPPPPPANLPPSLSNPTQPQEVFANGETYPNICVTASAKNGNSITVGFGTQYGSMSPNTVSFSSSGVNKVCSTYKAPSTPDAAGKTETITFTVHDNTTGLNGSSVSVTFPIMAPPTRP